MGKFCIDERGTEKETLTAFRKMQEGPHRQPCEVCGKKVNIEFCFCFVCGRLLCDNCSEKDPVHATSITPLKI